MSNKRKYFQMRTGAPYAYDTPIITPEFLLELQVLLLKAQINDITNYYGVSLYWLRKVIKENSLETLQYGYCLSKKFLNFHSGLFEY